MEKVKIVLLSLSILALIWSIRHLDPRDKTQHWAKDPFGWAVAASGIAVMLGIANL
jgi:hypothetical protein